MGIAALIAWVVTAGFGFVMLGIWISKGGLRKDQPRASHFPPAVILGHFALAAIGLVVWIVYLIADKTAIAWVGFVLLLPVALLGFTMFVRWIPTCRAIRAAHSAGSAATRSSATAKGDAVGSTDALAERHFPVPVVLAHGVVAVVTLVLVLLTAITE
jgi:hypothetical protein